MACLTAQAVSMVAFDRRLLAVQQRVVANKNSMILKAEVGLTERDA
jgi:hypothetical protein